MNNIKISKIDLKDMEQLQIIGRETFFETFSNENTMENMQKYLAEGFGIGKLTKEINNPNAEFYFAEVDSKIVGYLKINFGQAQTELKNNKSLEIERIYVLKELHGKKVGQTLYEKALTIAKQKGVEFLWLGVWEKNLKAINFYKKNGFIEFDKHIFKLGNDEQTEIMMKLNID
ncbi:MAG: GNAT family N-acetyltransferase [Bacteroidia bacterium]|nr:GNAT family N-acetyltransferase [Bacteroidia bacterium]